MFNNVLRIDATYRSKISRDRYQIQFDVNLYPLSVFANTPFKLFSGEYQWLDGWPSWIWYGRLDFRFFTFFFIKDYKIYVSKCFTVYFLKFYIFIYPSFSFIFLQCFIFSFINVLHFYYQSFTFIFVKFLHFYS